MFTHTFYLPGTMQSDARIKAAMPRKASLIHVSVSAKGKNKGSLKIGARDEPGKYMKSKKIGAGSPEEYSRLDFEGEQFPRFIESDVVVYEIRRGGEKEPAEDVTLVVTFEE